MGFVYVLLAVIIIFGILAMVYISFYNVFQYTKTKIEQAESLIDETLRVRYDLIIRVNNLVKAAQPEEKSYFKDIDNLKDANISNFDMDRKLAEYVQLFEQLKKDFKKLDENRGIKDISKEIKDTEEKLSASKLYYNKNVTDFNRLVRMFPANLVARMHKLEAKNYFDDKNMQDDDTNDFKL